MRIKDGFVLREVAGQIMVVATGEASRNFSGMIKLNETGRFVWEAVSAGYSVDGAARELAARYGIGLAQAREDVSELVAQMQAEGFIDA